MQCADLKTQSRSWEIGKFAASLIEDNDIIALDTGTDTESFAEQIQGVCGIKIITNSLKIAQILTDKRKNGDFDGKIIMLGGEIDSDTECAYSPLTTQCCRILSRQGFYRRRQRSTPTESCRGKPVTAFLRASFAEWRKKRFCCDS